MPPRGGAEIFPQGRCIMMHCRCCGWWGCCPYHNCCSPHIWQRINFKKKSEVNIQKSPLDRLLRPVSLAGDALVLIPNNDISIWKYEIPYSGNSCNLWEQSWLLSYLQSIWFCGVKRVLWFVGKFKRLTLNSSTETPIVRLRLRVSTCGKSLRSGFE